MTSIRSYLVEMHGDVREVYAVQASSPEEAQARWMDGDLVVSETMGTEFYSVREDDE